MTFLVSRNSQGENRLVWIMSIRGEKGGTLSTQPRGESRILLIAACKDNSIRQQGSCTHLEMAVGRITGLSSFLGCLNELTVFAGELIPIINRHGTYDIVLLHLKVDSYLTIISASHRQMYANFFGNQGIFCNFVPEIKDSYEIETS